MKCTRIFSLLFLSFLLLSHTSSIECMELGEDIGEDALSQSAKAAEDAAEDSVKATAKSFNKVADVAKGLQDDTEALTELRSKTKALREANKARSELAADADESAINNADEAIKKAQDDLRRTINKHDPITDDLTESANTSMERAESIEKDAIKDDPKKADDIRAKRKKLRDALDKDPPSADEIREAQKELDEAMEGPGIGSKILHGAKDMGLDILKQLPMVVVFTVPNILQSAIQAEKQRDAALKTVAQPVQFGDWVLQIPKEAISSATPEESYPLYSIIPVSSVGAQVSADTARAFNNSVELSKDDSMEIHDVSVDVQRYKISNASDFYKKSKFVLSYPAQVYNNIGDSLITGPQFAGLMIDMTTGTAIDGTGEHYNAVFPVPLLPMKDHAPSIQQQPVTPVSQALPGILAKMSEAGLTKSYQAYTGGSGPSMGSLYSWFDCNDATGTSKTAHGTCVIQGALEKYSSGTTAGVFGQVVPVYGWSDTDYDKIINKQNFPQNVPLSFDQSGAIVTDLGKVGAAKRNLATKSSPGAKSVYAPKANYAAQGCWVYLATETPFAKRVQQGATQHSVMGPFVDYVIFFDAEMNQVALQVPVETAVAGTDGAVKWPEIALNPDIKYMASLIGTGLADFQTEYQGKLIPVMYELNGEKASMADLPNKVGQAIQGLQQSFPLLYDQFQAHRNALISKYHYGPFVYGSTNLTDNVDYNVAVGSVNLKFYQGTECFGSDVNDLLLPMADGNTAVLPNTNVTEFVSLITDIVYELQADKTLKPSNFTHAPGTWNGKTFTPNEREAGSFFWFGEISGAKGANPADIKRLSSYIQQQRQAWLERFSDSQLLQGVTLGNLSFKLASGLNWKDAELNKAFIYDVTPSPSADLTDHDWFIAVDSVKPTLDGLELINLAQNPEAKSLVSLVTGNVYDMNGKLRIARNRPVVIVTTGTGQKETTSQHLYEYISTAFPVGKGLTEGFKEKLAAEVNAYASDMNRIITQGDFAGINLGIYAGDLAMKNYVYINTAGMTTEKEFVPKDLLVTVSTVGGKTTFGAELSKNTQYMVSLISGQIYATDGPSGEIDRKTVWGYANGNGFYWRGTLKSIFDQLKVSYISNKAAEKKEQDELEQEAQKRLQGVTITEAQIKTIINRLSKPLPAPYSTLRQDPITQAFVHVTQNPNDPDDVAYTFFNVPNTYKDEEGKPVPCGGIYNQDGKLLQLLKGSVLEAMKHQFGLYGSATKTLGIPMKQPSLLMSQKDWTLKPGSNGETMIFSSSENFPGYSKVRLPKNHYMYYSTIMNTYYVLNSETDQWTSVVGGNLYQRNGQPVPVSNKVALNTSPKSSGADIMMLEKNADGSMQGIMPNPFYDNNFTQFKNEGNDVWKSSYGTATVSVASAKKARVSSSSAGYYTVMFENASKTRQERKVYELIVDYQWQNLTFIPISQNFEPLSRMPEASFLGMQVISKDGKLVNVMFGGRMYGVKQTTTANAYELVSFDSKAPTNMYVQLLIDKNTNVPYVQVTVESGKVADSYRYGYDYKQLDESEQEAMRSFIEGNIAVCPVNAPVGPMEEREVKVGSRVMKVTSPQSRTYTLFIPDIENIDAATTMNVSNVMDAPPEGSADLVPLSSMLFRVKKTTGGRFIANLYKNDGKSFHEPFISYFNRNGYVDLQTGALFDETGRSVGASLQLKDWLAVLNKLQVMVNKSKSGKLGLYYRRPSLVKKQAAEQGAQETVGQALEKETGSRVVAPRATRQRVARVSQPSVAQFA